jgi:thiol-disulfide isomerase/thioredoxin
MKTSFFTLLLVLSANIFHAQNFLKSGIYRGLIQANDSIQIPFNAEVNLNKDSLFFTIINGSEKLTSSIALSNHDTAIIPMFVFDADLKLYRGKNNQVEGIMIKNYVKDYTMPLTLIYGEKERFKESKPALVNLSGKYAVTFNNNGSLSQAIGLFEQTNNLLYGTFLTETGDYRFLEGKVFDSSFVLSAFDGEHAYLFRGKLGKNKRIKGEFFSGKTGYRSFSGTFDPNAKLRDPYALTYLKEGYETFEIEFPDLNGNKVSLNDERFKNKAVVIQILGTWCPNCMDETEFLSNWYNKRKIRDIEIVGLAFEAKNDFDYAAKRLNIFKKKYNIKYEILFCGLSGTKSASEALPMLNKVMSFPTTIFLNKKHQLVKIHTGFNGPGTGKYYEEFIESFNQNIQLISNSE